VISLNPKKSVFAVTEGKVLGCIISKDGIVINLERIQAINSIAYPRFKREMKHFLGKIIFFYRFISGFSNIAKPLQNMINKDVTFKWTRKGKEAFH
jgi:hypothetical protein